MSRRARDFVRRHWPRLRLRTLLLAVLIFAAGLPGIGAVFLRVYENTLVRQTEAELISQAAALASAAEVNWPGAALGPSSPMTSFVPSRRGSISVPRPCCRNGLIHQPMREHQIPTPWPPDAKIALILAGTRRVTLASIMMLDSRAASSPAR